MSRTRIPRYYYHLTDEDWGESILLKPRVEGKKRDVEFEPSVSRICVSSSIEGCFVSVYLCDLNHYRIYRTKKKVLALKPYEILDSHITDEHWLDSPTEFILLGCLSITHIRDIVISSRPSNMGGLLGDGESVTQNWQKETKLKIKKILAKNPLGRKMKAA